jgi:spore germination protein YaaH
VPLLRMAFIVTLLTSVPAASSELHSRHHSLVLPMDAALEKARDQVLDSFPLAMFYYSNDSLGMTSLNAHAGAMTVIAPQCYTITPDGSVHGELPMGVLDATRVAGLPLMPLVTNPGFDRAAAHTLLHDLKAQQHAVSALAETAAREQFVGWQLDFEGIDPADKLAYTHFAARIAARLHHDHRLLSIAVVPRFSDVFPDSASPGFHTGEWGAAFDYPGLARVADYLVLMAYDQHTSLTAPGPVAGFDWVSAALDYACRRVPPYKLLLGIPLYGREWVESPQGMMARSLTFEDLKDYLKNPGTDRYWDELFRTTRFQLHDPGEVRTAWFDDARSLREKLKLVETYHLRGYAAWRLGVEDPEFWQSNRK